MKKIILILVVLSVSAALKAQSDSSNASQPDTIIVGKFIIVKKNRTVRVNNLDGSGNTFNINLGRNRDRKPSNTSTNWFIFDWGFTNYRDQTDYASANQNPYLHNGGQPFGKTDFNLQTRSSNVNIWIFMQKINLSSHILNLKYGLGLNMYNFRYDNNISYNKSPAYIFRDSIQFSKDKLFTSYATVPLLLNVNTAPNKRNGFSFSAGVSAGYLVASRNKQISTQRGKQKIKGDLNLDKWQLSYIAELGLGPVRLYGSYSITPLHQDALKQYPYTIGVRFSNW